MKKSLIIILHISLLLNFIAFPVNAENQEKFHIQINLWSNELLVFKNNKQIKRYPISPGADLSPTPIGTYTITKKSRSWGGGFGTRWLGLDVPWGMYGIHGTNRPYLIGDNISSGCIRLRNADIEQLYELIPIGTEVHIDGSLTGNGDGEYKNLAIGSKGNLVQLVQNRLKAMGLYDGSEDGIYSTNTDWAIRKFQKMNNLPINGVVSYQEYLLLGLLE